jgi:hypothetical protein
MSETQNPSAERYRETAEEIRFVAHRTCSPEIRMELFDLADRYDRRPSAPNDGRALPIDPQRHRETQAKQ